MYHVKVSDSHFSVKNHIQVGKFEHTILVAHFEMIHFGSPYELSCAWCMHDDIPCHALSKILRWHGIIYILIRGSDFGR